MRFLIDENLPADIAADLVTAGHDALEVADSEHRGADDSVIWRVAIAESRILVARDLDFPLPKALGRPREWSSCVPGGPRAASRSVASSRSSSAGWTWPRSRAP